MKAFFRFFVTSAVVCFLGAYLSSQAQYVQTSDEVSILQATNITDTPASPVRGVSDDGKRVVFESAADITGGNPDLNLEVFVYEVDKRTFIQVTNTQHVYDPADADKPFNQRRILISVSANNAAISGDGTRIVFSSNSGTLIPGDAGKNDDGNQEIFLATLPLNATSASFQRITTTAASTVASGPTEVFDNYNPTINFNGSLIAFVTNRKELPGVTNPDGIGQIVIYNTNIRQFTQVTNKNEADGTSGFSFKAFNNNPQLSGNGNVLVFISGFNLAPTASVNNSDLNGEIFLYDVVAKTTTQLTNTTGFAGFPASLSQDFQGNIILTPSQPINIFNQNTKRLSNDGNLLVFESAGDFDSGKNTDKTREVFLYNRATNKFTQLTTNATLSSSPKSEDLAKIDFNFTPGISPDGKFVFLSSILNIVPVASGGTSNAATDNADGSREIFRYDVTAAKFRQITYTPQSVRVLDQREALLFANSNASGSSIFFTDDVNLLGTNADTSFEIYRAIVRPVTQTNDFVPALVNAASFASPDSTTPASNPAAPGSIASIFGTKLADSQASTIRSDLDYELNGVSVAIAGIAARLVFVSPTQINFIIPEGFLAADGVEFIVNNKGVASKGKFKVLASSPGIFTITQDGKGSAAVACQVVTKDASGTVIGTTYPPPPCTVSKDLQESYLLLFGTGIRFADLASVSVTLIKADNTTQDYVPVYAGSQNQFPGLDQVNLLLPADFPTGTVKLKIKATSGGTTVESNVFEVVVLAAQ
ncbi:MAG: PD40 domain-containing protein [Acidobacteria bacterium]|nr:PD40 domain-containing protein [Acidobacteriota bacterium]